MDPIEKAKQGMGGVERAFTGLPGVAGYREKEMRRDADKKVRETLAHRLDDGRRRLTDLQSQLLSGGGLAFLADLERVGSRLQTLIDRIRTASYGYAGFFDLQRVKEAELDRLAAFDQALFDQLAPLDQALDELAKAIAANQGVKEAIQPVSDLVTKLADDFGHRTEAMQASA
ncbi:MAG TPA: hypothetical protein VGA61_20835 [Anaerolineae bacterium]